MDENPLVIFGVCIQHDFWACPDYFPRDSGDPPDVSPKILYSPGIASFDFDFTDWI